VKNFLLLFVSIFPLSTFAYNIDGEVINEDGEPVTFANIILFSVDDSSVVTGSYSDTLGHFSFDYALETPVYIEINHLLSETYTSENFQGDKTFGQITLKNASNNLDVVDITVQKKMFQQTGRGMVVNVESSPILQSGSTKDVLSRIPGVIMNQDGSLTLKGKSNILIYMDGKPSYLSLEDLMRYLENTPANEIEKIEVFETPPAKYDAAGNAGIINIVRAKGKGNGLEGSLGTRLGYGNYHKSGYNANLSYRKNKLFAYGSGWYYNNMVDQRTTADMRIVESNDTSHYFNSFHNVYHPFGYGARGGLDYDITDSTTIGFMVLHYDGESHTNEPGTTEVSGKAREQNDFSRSITKGLYEWSGNSYNTYLKHNINQHSEIKIDADIAFRSNSNYGLNENYNFLNNSNVGSRVIEQNGQTDITIFASQLDYSHNKVFNWEIESGAKYSSVGTRNRFSSNVGNSIGTLEEDTNALTGFEYTEQILAGYLTFARKIKETSFDFGIRVENTIANGASNQSSNTFSRSYLNFFPNFAINHEINKSNTLGLSFSRRINRPNYNQLNPFVSQLNQFTLFKGNPNLLPQLTNVLNATYGYKNAAFLTLSGSLTQGAITRVVVQDEENALQEYQIINLDNIYNYSANISFPIPFYKWWTTNLNGTYYYNEIASGFAEGDILFQLHSFSINMQSIFTLPKGFKLEWSGFYNHDSYWNIWFVEPHYQMDLGLTKSVGDFRFNLSFQDFLNIREGNGGIFQGDVYTETTYKPESRKVLLNVSYFFGNKKIKKNAQRKTSSEDLQNRG
jgi:hypothetical protein